MTKGIENLFNKNKFEDRFYEVGSKNDGGSHRSLKKKAFMDYMIENGTKEDFAKFEPLTKEIKRIVDSVGAGET